MSMINILKEMLAMSESDINSIYNTGFFNDISLAYAKVAMKNTGIDEDLINDVIYEMTYLFDKKTSGEIKECVNKA